MYSVQPAELKGQVIKRKPWTPNFKLPYPEDFSLAIETGIKDEVPSELLEIYVRFISLGFVQKHGHQCVLMSNLLRRILKYHGFSAVTRQVILYYENETKQVKMTVGSQMHDVKENEIDVHLVTIINDKWLLDFGATQLMQFGAVYPRAFIARATLSDDDWQDFGNMHGRATWIRSYPPHPLIKHFRLEQHDKEKQLTKEYFRVYAF